MKWEVVYSTSKRQYHARFRASNGRILFWSEQYHNRADAVAAIVIVQVNGPKAPIVDVTVP